MASVDPVGVDLARRIYDYGLTADDFGPRQFGLAAATISGGKRRSFAPRPTSCRSAGGFLASYFACISTCACEAAASIIALYSPGNAS